MSSQGFKDSPVGRVPVDWDVVRLGDITTFIKGKKPDKLSDEYFENALPYLTTDYLRFHDKIKFATSKNGIIINEDDLILLWDGANAGEFFKGFNGVLASTMVKLDLDDRNICRDFLFYKLKTKEKFLKLQTVGTGIPHVNRSVINSLRISIPPLEEQERIAGILRDTDERLELLNKRKEVLENIKRGLMNDLLTGKRRVKIPA